MIQLHDGVKPVRSIAILALFRNCEKFLPTLFPSLEAFENEYSVAFTYYFLENNSTDNTNKLLKDFMRTRNGKFIEGIDVTFDKEAHTPYSIKPVRVSKMVYLRNFLFNSCKADFANVDWLLMIDSDIAFDSSVLRELFSKSPAKNNIGMLSPYGSEVVHVKDEGTNKYATMYHYYDSFAIIYADGYTTRPFCRFDKCGACVNTKGRQTLPTIPRSQDIVDVKSCFGGFMLIDNSCMKSDSIRWDSILFCTYEDTATCEHVLFCYKFAAITNKRICIAQNVNILCSLCMDSK